jgi:MtN3 and saliva related transmembrane protein
MTSWLPTLVGLIAGCLSTYSYLPQVQKVWREGDAEAISKRMFAIRAGGLVLWSIYGVAAGSLPVVLFSLVSLALSITLLVLKLRHAAGQHAPHTGAAGGA